MVPKVVPQVAPLAKRRQVAEPVVGFVLVQVGNRKHHLTPRYRVRLAILSPAELAPVLRPPEPDQLAYQLPLRMILLVINRHGAPPLSLHGFLKEPLSLRHLQVRTLHLSY